MKRLLRSYVYNGFVWELNCSTSGELNDDKSSIVPAHGTSNEIEKHIPIADSGATDTLFCQTDTHLLQDVQTSIRPLNVGLPNGQTISPVSSGTLRIGESTSIPAHVFPNAILDRTLLSLAGLCNEGCTVTLTSRGMRVTNAQGEEILHTTKSPHQKLWPVSHRHIASSNTVIGESNAVISHKYNDASRVVEPCVNQVTHVPKDV
jgi:hypothetical protein